ncbi:F-box protein AFR [Senna tora]|uniref:F-box protein AFR n=1 Tax=Senna tora TaxID=362788 RepID=A0A834U128_9FABA|nr:F-box protein AFR [Senna tora]
MPNEIAELCLVHLPYPYHALARSVSSSWNRAITHPTFLLSKKSLSLSRPYLFVSAFHKSTGRMQWQALDPSSGRWFVLPPTPNHVTPAASACASLPRHGKLFLIGATHPTFIYRTSTNQWSQSSPIPITAAPSSLTAAEINGQIITVGGTSVQSYDPETDTWEARGKIEEEEMEIGKSYDSAVVGGKLYVTEGWTWPFMFSPRGAVYDSERERWGEMRRGMREGWTGVSAVVRGRVMVISEYGDCPVKVYEEGGDRWEYVGGERFPREALQRPLRVRGEDEGGRIYVVSAKLNVGIGRVEIEERGGKERVKVKWEVLQAPKAFAEFSPSHCHLLYA